MTPARFIALTEAYGADRRRWPEAERATADAFAVQHPDMARQVLADADDLDALDDVGRSDFLVLAQRETFADGAGANGR